MAAVCVLVHAGRAAAWTEKDAPLWDLVRTAPSGDVDAAAARKIQRQTIRAVIAAEAAALGVKPTFKALTEWVLGRCHPKRRPEVQRLLQRRPLQRNPLVHQLLWQHREAIASAGDPADLGRNIKPWLPAFKEIYAFQLKPSEADLQDYVAPGRGRPTLLLSAQSDRSVSRACRRGEFPGYVCFSGDTVNDLFRQRQLVLVTPYRKVKRVAPTAPINNSGHYTEREWRAFGNVPIEAIDVVLPSALFPPLLDSPLSPVRDFAQQKRLSPAQAKQLTEHLKTKLRPIMPAEYARSLAYTYRKTGSILTPAQSRMLRDKRLDVEAFWAAGLRPLASFVRPTRRRR